MTPATTDTIQFSSRAARPACAHCGGLLHEPGDCQLTGHTKNIATRAQRCGPELYRLLKERVAAMQALSSLGGIYAASSLWLREAQEVLDEIEEGES